MSGTAMVHTSTKDWNQRKTDWAGTEHLAFSDIWWAGAHSRDVIECPVCFAFVGVGFLRVCTNTTYI